MPEKQNIKLATVSAIDITLKVLTFAQMKAAQEKGYTVYGVCSQGPNFQYLKVSNIKMHAVEIRRKISLLSDLKALFHLYRFFKKENIDIVHAHTPKPVFIAPVAAKLAGVPVTICTLRGFMVREELKTLPKLFYRFMAWVSAKCSTFLLCQNPEDVQRYIDAGICKQNKIAPLGNGVDLQKFNPHRFSQNDKNVIRQKLGIPKDAILICVIGRLVREKGYIELFEAMHKVIAGCSNVWLMIIGPEEPEKTDRISPDTFRQYGIENRIKYLHTRNDIPELLACCNIYTLPSWREGFPRSAIEAAAMGLPIVTTNIRGCRQVVEDGVNGILVPVNDSDALAEALLKLIVDSQLREKMGKAGYKKAQSQFDEKKVCEIVIDTYQRLLKARENR